MLDTSYLHTQHVQWLQGKVEKLKDMDCLRRKMYLATNPKYDKTNYEAWGDISEVNDHYYYTDEILAAVYALNIIEASLRKGDRSYTITIEEGLHNVFSYIDRGYTRNSHTDLTFCHFGAVNCAQQILENTNLYLLARYQLTAELAHLRGKIL